MSFNMVEVAKERFHWYINMHFFGFFSLWRGRSSCCSGRAWSLIAGPLRVDFALVWTSFVGLISLIQRIVMVVDRGWQQAAFGCTPVVQMQCQSVMPLSQQTCKSYQADKTFHLSLVVPALSHLLWREPAWLCTVHLRHWMQPHCPALLISEKSSTGSRVQFPIRSCQIGARRVCSL